MPNHTFPRRKRVRLDPAAYADTSAICLITTCTADRAPIFANPTVAQSLVDLMTLRAKTAGVRVWAYCLMPDHLHLLLSPSASVSILVFVGELKGAFSKVAREKGHKEIWQQGLHDHFLRRDEDTYRTVEYILANPVRRGLVYDWQDYPFSGSLVYPMRGKGE